MSSSIEALTEVNLQDLVSAFGWQRRPALRAVLRTLFRGLARRFARYMLEFDDDVGRLGLPEGSRRFARRRLARDVRVFCREHVPAGGSLLVLSNHPGMSDTVALFAAINRSDLKIIALQNPFLSSLVNVSEHLYYIGEDEAEKVRLFRQAAAHLRRGHAALTFPAGRIEPDPEVHEGAADSLAGWSDSAGIFMRFAPETVIVPALVSGVIWERTARHWLTRIRRNREEREQLAAALQLLVTLTRKEPPSVVKVRFARPVTLAEIGAPETARIHRAVIARMRELLDNPPRGEGVSAL